MKKYSGTEGFGLPVVEITIVKKKKRNPLFHLDIKTS